MLIQQGVNSLYQLAADAALAHLDSDLDLARAIKTIRQHLREATMDVATVLLKRLLDQTRQRHGMINRAAGDK